MDYGKSVWNESIATVYRMRFITNIRNIFLFFLIGILINCCSSPTEPTDQDIFYIRFQITKASDVKIIVENNFSKEIITVCNNHCQPGAYAIPWDLKDENGKKLYEGIYHINIYIDDELFDIYSILIRNK